MMGELNDLIAAGTGAVLSKKRKTKNKCAAV
jgi:hypothetical protein